MQLKIGECSGRPQAVTPLPRYKDISPYDGTRVVLDSCPTGDYINANHVVMEVPGSGIVNRFVPLVHSAMGF